MVLSSPSISSLRICNSMASMKFPTAMSMGVVMEYLVFDLIITSLSILSSIFVSVFTWTFAEHVHANT